MPVPGSLSAVHLALATMGIQYKALDGVALDKQPGAGPRGKASTGPLLTQQHLAPPQPLGQLPGTGSQATGALGADAVVAFSAVEQSNKSAQVKAQRPLGEVLKDAGKKALGGGKESI